jgi:hypothetical protein
MSACQTGSPHSTQMTWLTMLCPGLMVMQGDRRAASVVEPPISPGEHGREDREEVAAHYGR